MFPKEIGVVLINTETQVPFVEFLEHSSSLLDKLQKSACHRVHFIEDALGYDVFVDVRYITLIFGTEEIMANKKLRSITKQYIKSGAVVLLTGVLPANTLEHEFQEAFQDFDTDWCLPKYERSVSSAITPKGRELFESATDSNIFTKKSNSIKGPNTHTTPTLLDAITILCPNQNEQLLVTTNIAADKNSIPTSSIVSTIIAIKRFDLGALIYCGAIDVPPHIVDMLLTLCNISFVDN